MYSIIRYKVFPKASKEYFVITSHESEVWSPNIDEALSFHTIELASKKLVELARKIDGNIFIINNKEI